MFQKNICILKTGISDFHKLTPVSLKLQILKAPLKRKLCKDYKAFDENEFNNDLKRKQETPRVVTIAMIYSTSIILEACI